MRQGGLFSTRIKGKGYALPEPTAPLPERTLIYTMISSPRITMDRRGSKTRTPSEADLWPITSRGIPDYPRVRLETGPAELFHR